MSASPDADDPSTPDVPDGWNTRPDHVRRIASNSVTTISSSQFNVIRRWLRVLLFKPVPPLESSYGFDEWQKFIPDSPVFNQNTNVPSFFDRRFVFDNALDFC